ncbi:unnamed protein product [Symbiodinium natans]|uniref:Uncharacterized protein n=1 Tax=Symbiodinium natans TaxID=878477 RepID=A0A812R8B1_9DINO|nr:unnamed protein product [Symbiodinium natans]
MMDGTREEDGMLEEGVEEDGRQEEGAQDNGTQEEAAEEGIPEAEEDGTQEAEEDGTQEAGEAGTQEVGEDGTQEAGAVVMVEPWWCRQVAAAKGMAFREATRGGGLMGGGAQLQLQPPIGADRIPLATIPLRASTRS